MLKRAEDGNALRQRLKDALQQAHQNGALERWSSTQQGAEEVRKEIGATLLDALAEGQLETALRSLAEEGASKPETTVIKSFNQLPSVGTWLAPAHRRHQKNFVAIATVEALAVPAAQPSARPQPSVSESLNVISNVQGPFQRLPSVATWLAGVGPKRREEAEVAARINKESAASERKTAPANAPTPAAVSADASPAAPSAAPSSGGPAPVSSRTTPFRLLPSAGTWLAAKQRSPLLAGPAHPAPPPPPPPPTREAAPGQGERGDIEVEDAKVAAPSQQFRRPASPRSEFLRQQVRDTLLDAIAKAPFYHQQHVLFLSLWRITA